MEKKYLVEVTPKTIVFTVFFLLLLKFLWLIKSIIFSLIIAFIISSAFKPIIRFLVNFKMPRLLATIMTYILFIFFSVSLFYFIIPPLIIEFSNLIKNFPLYLNTIFPEKNTFDINLFLQQAGQITTSFFNLVKLIFSNIIFLISALFFSFYFSLEENVIRKFIDNFLPEDKSHMIKKIIDKIEQRLNSWFWAEIILMTIVGSLTYFGLTIIGLPYAFSLAALAGLLEAIPNLGPVISAKKSKGDWAAQSPFDFFVVTGLYFLIQQMENNLIVPLVMKKTVNLNPLITLLALLIGGQIAGVAGVLLSVPVALILETIFLELKKKS